MSPSKNTFPQVQNPAFASSVFSALAGLASVDLSSADARLSTDVWSALYQLDGINEVLEWNNEGVGADEVACMWLAQLRMIRSVHGFSPQSAPYALDRDIDKLPPTTSSEQVDPVVLRALNEPDMQLLEKSVTSGLNDDGALVRSLVLGFLPVEDTKTVATLTARSAALTHGHPDVVMACVALALIMRYILTEVSTGDTRQGESLELFTSALHRAAAWWDILPLPQLPGEGKNVRRLLEGYLDGQLATENLDSAERTLAQALLSTRKSLCPESALMGQATPKVGVSHRAQLISRAWTYALTTAPLSKELEASWDDQAAGVMLVWKNFAHQLGIQGS